MEESPEGLNYGKPDMKLAKTPINENYKEKGKLQTGSILNADHEKAETLRMLGKSCHDPMYKNHNKNKS